MDISPAALPPIPAHYTKADEAHPLFGLYRQHLNGCARLLIAASDFRDWLYQYEMNQRNEAAAKRPEYPAFLGWMRAEKAGRRKCLPTADLPEGLSFPHNFYFWIEGGRW